MKEVFQVARILLPSNLIPPHLFWLYQPANNKRPPPHRDMRKPSMYPAERERAFDERIFVQILQW